MRKFVLILGLFLIFCTRVNAEIYHGIGVDLVYKNGSFNNKEEVKTLINNYLQRDITENDDNKTTVSNMIDNHYHNPEYIPVMEAKCQESMEWIKGNFVLWEEPNFRADMCLTWEINKKLTNEQIETFAHLKKTWEDVISDLVQGNDFRNSFPTYFDNQQEFSLQLAVRVYNLVLHQDWPECLYETNKVFENIYFYKKPCNKSSKIMIKCKNSTNIKKCMKNKIISKVMKFKTLNSKWVTKKEILEKRKKNLEKLFNLTENFISQITNNTTMQKEEIIRLYNFYWLSILISYKMNLDYVTID